MTGSIASPRACAEVPTCASPAYAGEACSRCHIPRVKAPRTAACTDGLRPIPKDMIVHSAPIPDDSGDDAERSLQP